MKKFVKIAALSAAAALTLAACGDAPEKTESSAPNTSAEGTSEFKGCMVSDFGGFDDNSFNETSFSGLERAQAELGIKIADAESKDASEYTTNVDTMVQAGCSLIFNVGFNLADATLQSAQSNTDQHFALIDSALADPTTFEPITLQNVKPILFNTHEAAYLAGYVAAGVSKSGTVATFGGQPYPSVTIFMDGFVDGVEKYNTENDAKVKVLGWDKEKQTGSFSETFDEIGKGKELTEQFISQGADIIMPVAGPVGEGAMAAASGHDDVYIIGVDTDAYLKYEQYRDIILTSVLKGMDTAVFDTIKAAKEDSWDATPYVGTLENGGVGIAEFHNLDSKVSEDIKVKVEDIKTQIVSGELKVESKSATVVK
ncbi:BMP family lipoprotein [Timonella sp. A28]|uniref:BMP family lipoprotein n=1 Tax=Timonella sp. A28 TaxID=3442640 RepID=UPI003EBB1F8E